MGAHACCPARLFRTEETGQCTMGSPIATGHGAHASQVWTRMPHTLVAVPGTSRHGAYCTPKRARGMGGLHLPTKHHKGSTTECVLPQLSIGTTLCAEDQGCAHSAWCPPTQHGGRPLRARRLLGERSARAHSAQGPEPHAPLGCSAWRPPAPARCCAASAAAWSPSAPPGCGPRRRPDRGPASQGTPGMVGRIRSWSCHFDGCLAWSGASCRGPVILMAWLGRIDRSCVRQGTPEA